MEVTSQAAGSSGARAVVLGARRIVSSVTYIIRRTEPLRYDYGTDSSELFILFARTGRGALSREFDNPSLQVVVSSTPLYLLPFRRIVGVGCHLLRLIAVVAWLLSLISHFRVSCSPSRPPHPSSVAHWRFRIRKVAARMISFYQQSDAKINK